MSSALLSSLLSALARAKLEGGSPPSELRQRRKPWAAGSPPLEAKTNDGGSHTNSFPIFRQKAETSKVLTEQPSGGARLQQFPAELVVQITQYLTLSSAMALSQTCHRFREMTDVYIGDLFPPASNAPRTQAKSEALKADQLEFLNLLVPDDKLSSTKMVCSACTRVHKVDLFSPTARLQDPCERKCVGHEGGVWLCPHTILYRGDYQEQQRHFSPPIYPRRCCCPLEIIASSHTTLLITYHLISADRWDRSDLDVHVDVKQVAEVLQAAKVPFCPHRRSDDPDIIDNVLLSNPEPWQSLSHKNPYWQAHFKPECHFCGTKIEVHSTKYPWPQIVATVLRRCGDSEGLYPATDSRWFTQLTNPQRFAPLAEEWDRSRGSWPKDGRAPRTPPHSLEWNSRARAHMCIKQRESREYRPRSFFTNSGIASSLDIAPETRPQSNLEQSEYIIKTRRTEVYIPRREWSPGQTGSI